MRTGLRDVLTKLAATAAAASLLVSVYTGALGVRVCPHHRGDHHSASSVDGNTTHLAGGNHGRKSDHDVPGHDGGCTCPSVGLCQLGVTVLAAPAVRVGVGLETVVHMATSPATLMQLLPGRVPHSLPYPNAPPVTS